MKRYDDIKIYLDALQDDPSLAIITFQMAADAFDLSRAAIEVQVKAGKLSAISIGGGRYIAAASVGARLTEARREISTIKAYLEQLARKGQTTTYGALMERFGMSSAIPADRKRIGQLLGAISEESYTERGVLLSIIVHNARAGLPSQSFFDLAADVDEEAFDRCESDDEYYTRHMALLRRRYTK